MSPTILAFDLSLRATGIAGNRGEGWAHTISPPPKLAGHQRLAYIRHRIFDDYIANTVDPYIVVEGPAFGAKGDAYHQLAGLWWLITHGMFARQLPVTIVPPTTLKKYVTGKGNAGKDDIIREITRRFPWFQGDNNAADATGLAAMAADFLGLPMAVMPGVNRAALRAVDWAKVGQLT